MAIDLFELIGQDYEFDAAIAELIDSGEIGGGGGLTVNRETITADKTLTGEDDIVQHLITSTASLEVFLPASPELNDQFIVVNSASSTENFVINSVTLTPGDIYEVIYDGVEWVEI